MDESRAKAIEDGANVSTGGVNFNYVSTAVLERLGIDRYNTKKPKGNNFIRVVAPSKTGPFAKEIWKHSNVGANGATFLCLDRMFSKPCPVCEYITELKKEGSNDEVINELAAGRRYLLFVVDTTSQETEEEGPKWFDCPITVYKAICHLSKDKKSGETIDPTDPEDGRDVWFTRVDGGRTEYTSFELKKTDPIPKSWYKDLPTFDEVLLIPSYDEVAKAVSGKASSGSKGGSSGEGSRERTEDGEGRRTRSGSRGESEDGGEGRTRSRPRESSEEDSSEGDAVRKKLNDINERRRSKREE